MLIVVIVLGILAMIIIPQITVSTEDAKLSTLKTNLNTIRSAIELYYHQHNQTYPGAVDESDGSTEFTGTTGSESDAAEAFIAQLTTYTEASGEASVSKTGDFIYGPYIKKATLPTNPFTETSDLTCDTDEADVTERTADTGTKAWKFYITTGVFIANDSLNRDHY